MTEPDPAADGEIAQRVREELSRRRMSRQGLADAARISLSTLEKALAGTRPFTLASVLRIEQALGIQLRGAAPVPDTAPDGMGAYTRAGVRWLEGRYLTVRPSFGTPGGVHAWLTTIRWLDGRGHLGFAESARVDSWFEQSGHVSLPSLSGQIYLVTNELGQYRIAILCRPTIDRAMFGVLASLQVGPGSQLVPVASPVALRRLEGEEAPVLGLVPPGAPAHEGYLALLRTATADDFVRLYATGGRVPG